MRSPGHKIRLLFVTSIILMLGSHSLLPHHHHYDSHFSHEYPLPVDSNPDAGESDNPGYHCHAFNHLLDDGYQHRLIKLIRYQPLFAPAITKNLPVIKECTIIRWEIPNIKLVAQGYDHYYSLRDPPPFVFPYHLNSESIRIT